MLQKEAIEKAALIVHKAVVRLPEYVLTEVILASAYGLTAVAKYRMVHDMDIHKRSVLNHSGWWRTF